MLAVIDSFEDRQRALRTAIDCTTNLPRVLGDLVMLY
jgi:hypothetical protein